MTTRKGSWAPTAGARYVLYVDGIVAGGFSTPHGILPGPEEYYNGLDESGDSSSDNACSFEPIVALAGEVSDANIAFNANPDAPQVHPPRGATVPRT